MLIAYASHISWRLEHIGQDDCVDTQLCNIIPIHFLTAGNITSKPPVPKSRNDFDGHSYEEKEHIP